MPTPGNNAATYVGELRRLIMSLHTAGPDDRYTDAYLLSLINDAFLEINSDLKITLRRRKTIDLATSDTGYYGIGQGIIQGDEILNIWLDPAAGSAADSLKDPPLERLSYAEFESRYNVDDLPSGRPVAWTFSTLDRLTSPTTNSDHEDRQIVLSHIPDFTQTNAITVLYRTQSDPLYRLYNPGSAITMTVAHGATTFSLTVDSNNLVPFALAGDEIGFRRPVQSDNSTTASNELPMQWFRTVLLDNNGNNAPKLNRVTIEDTTQDTRGVVEPALAAGSGALEFVTAQVHNIEQQQPGKLGMAPAWMAASSLLLGDDPQRAQILLSRAMSRIDRLRIPEETGMVTRGFTPKSYYPFFSK